MQGASNFAIAKNYLDIFKPDLLILQETKCTLDNSSSFYHKLYNKFQSNNDVITLVRKDIKANMLQQPQLAFSCTILKVQGESSPIHVANVYARDNQLDLFDLQYIFDTYNNLILSGDLNAKHHLILPHTQKN